MLSISNAGVIWGKIIQVWQERWNTEGRGRHLFQIQNSSRVTRVGVGHGREAVVIMRLRIGQYSLKGGVEDHRKLATFSKYTSQKSQPLSSDFTLKPLLLYCQPSDWSVA